MIFILERVRRLDRKGKSKKTVVDMYRFVLRFRSYIKLLFSFPCVNGGFVIS